MNPGLLIVEGPDGVGKTSLVERLVAEYGAQPHHFGPPIPGRAVLPGLLRPVVDTWESIIPIVFDRFHFGGIAYGKVFREGPDLHDGEFYALEDVLSLRRTEIVLLDPPMEWAIENLKAKAAGRLLTDDERKFEDTSRWRAVRDGMWLALNKTNLPCHVIEEIDGERYDRVRMIVSGLGWEPR